MKLQNVRDAVSGLVPKTLLLGVPLFLQTVTTRAADLGRSDLGARGFSTEIGVSPQDHADAFAAELRAIAVAPDDAAIGPGPFARLIKSLRASVGQGVMFTGRKHAGTHLKSIFSMNRAAFIEKARGWAGKGTHSILVVSDDQAANLAHRAIDKLEEFNGLMAGKALDDVPMNQTVRLSGGSTVHRSTFYEAGDKLSVRIPAKDLGISLRDVGIFDAKAYTAAVDDAIAAGTDPKLIDPNTFCEAAKSVDELRFVFYGQLSTGQKLVSGLLTMYPNTQRVAIATAGLVTAAGTVQAKDCTVAGTSVDDRVGQLVDEHLAAFASQSGLGSTMDVSSAWDRFTETGAEIGGQIAIDWGLVTAFGSRVGGVLSLILMPTTLNGGEGASLAWQHQEWLRQEMIDNRDKIADAMVGDVIEHLGVELRDAGYDNGCDYADQIRPHIEVIVQQNLDALLGR